ncbi:hypothetical protein [Agromyces badenianii]|uniref:hypothetical protein n=1 Tax=Agromyces badenianii TaxID=2080742 RepID=UPI0010592DCA|nr:hypothetical protein [Agromyces badenianii]
MWYFDGYAWPGWHDYLGLFIALAGFWIAIDQIVRTRRETRKANVALARAQRHLTQRSLMAIIPQFQAVGDDLNYALPANDVEVAHRTLVRFSLMAREASGLLVGLEGDHDALSARLVKAAERATRAKATLVTEQSPDVIVVVKSVAAEVDRLSQDLVGLTSSLRNTIEGASGVH